MLIGSGNGFILYRFLPRILYHVEADISNTGVAIAFLGVYSAGAPGYVKAVRLWPLLIFIIIQSRFLNLLSCQIQLGEFDADPSEIKEGKLATLSLFAEALALYSSGKLAEAARLFAECLRSSPGDRVAKIYWERCQQQYPEF